MPFANVRISKESRVLHGWYIHPIPYEMTIKDFFVKLTTGELSPECNIAVTNSEEIERVELGKTPAAVATKVSPNCNIVEVTTNIGVHIHYRLKNEEAYALVPQQNSFTVMMQNARNARQSRLNLPTFSQSGRIDRKQALRNDIIDWIRNHGGGWTQSYANTQGKQFITSLTEAIWYIDMRDHKKLEERSYHIPALLHEFFGRASPESYKESRKSFDANELNLHCQALAPYTTSSWMLMTNFDWLRDALENFIVAISNYAGFLQRQRDITAGNHASEVPVRTTDQSTTIRIHKGNVWVAPIDKNKYYRLKCFLADLLPWEPVDIEEYLPTDPV